ncbi:hypothetical protein XENOCAPTIV_009842 [Xenoophorus captivus]|uniref:Uncharacterized protein n=1 Tax=Xenoophorus captivus TaxID=1517983 RepID=A0ABV0SF53_9TELE
MANCELIELKDLSVNDPIELAIPCAHIASASPGFNRIVRLVGNSISIEGPVHHAGEGAVGHAFQPYSYAHLTWCDLCGDFIWGLYKQSLRCANCSYTCHYRCRPFIQLACSTHGSVLTESANDNEDSIETDTNVDEETELGKQELSVGEIRQKVKEYNTQINNSLYMVDWDAFSFPELNNFLRILQREEEEHVRQIMKRYAHARDMIRHAMARVTTPG